MNIKRWDLATSSVINVYFLQYPIQFRTLLLVVAALIPSIHVTFSMKLFNTLCIFPVITSVMAYSSSNSSSNGTSNSLSLYSSHSSSVLSSFIQKSGEATSSGDAHFINVNHFGLVGGMLAAVVSLLV